MSVDRHSRGLIHYVGDATGERGREWFHRTDFADGSMTVRSVCEIDDLPLVREVTYSVNRDFRPAECYTRITVRGQTSSGWFFFSEGEVTCEGMLHDLGRISQRIAITEPPGYFGAHPLVGDVLDSAGYDLERGGRQTVRGFLSSPLVNGSSGPLAFPHQILVDDLGTEAVEVPAGRFDARRLRFTYGPGKAEDVWFTGKYEFVQVRNDELATSYVLVDVERWETASKITAPAGA